MQNYLFGLLLLFLPLSACNGIAQFGEPIGTLTEQWTKVNTDLNALQEQISGQSEQLNILLEEMHLPVETILPAALEQAKQRFQETAEERFSELKVLQTTIADVKPEWDSIGQRVEALQDGLSDGQLPASTPTEIADLQQVLGAKKDLLIKWTDQSNSIQADIEAAYRSVQEILTLIDTEEQG